MDKMGEDQEVETLASMTMHSKSKQLMKSQNNGRDTNKTKDPLMELTLTMRTSRTLPRMVKTS